MPSEAVSFTYSTLIVVIAADAIVPNMMVTGASPAAVPAGIVTFSCYSPDPTSAQYVTCAVAPPTITVGVVAHGR